TTPSSRRRSVPRPRSPPGQRACCVRLRRDRSGPAWRRWGRKPRPRPGRGWAWCRAGAWPAPSARCDCSTCRAHCRWTDRPPRGRPRAQTVAVRLSPGTHRALVRWGRAEGARFRLTLVRADGAPADFASAAPAELEGARLEAPCALGSICSAPPAWAEAPSLRRMAEERLREDDGDPLAAWLLARAAIGDERGPAR